MLFGRPSLNKFLKNDTFTTEARVKFEPEDSPVITVCALNPKQGTGWKKIMNYNKRFKEIEIHCNNLQDVTDTLECIKDNTYNLNKTIAKADLHKHTTCWFLPIGTPN